jgi:hypothetical protein
LIKDFLAFFLQRKSGNKQVVIDSLSKYDDSMIVALNDFRKIKEQNREVRIIPAFLNSLRREFVDLHVKDVAKVLN